MARTGVTESEAEAAGIDVVAATIKDRTRGGYYPDARPIWVKLVAEAGSGRLLGGQIVGVEGQPSASMCSRPASAQGCRSWSWGSSIWPLDFQFDQTADGRMTKSLP